MRHTLLVVIGSLLVACWADFPPELVRSDAAPGLDKGRDGSGRDHTMDGPPAEAAVDGPPVLLKLLGEGCTAAEECYTNRCVDGVCCNSACGGPCMRCDVSGRAGRCSPVPEGEDPDNECMQSPANGCAQDGMCDGRGGCRKWVAGTLCTPQLCATGGDKVVLGEVCDGKGMCLSFGEVSCAPYRCDPSTRRCFSSCSGGSGSAQCVTGATCSNGQCNGEKRPDGADCGLAGECESGHCVDGVCCDGSCTGKCRTCALAPTGVTAPPPIAGKCINTPSGLDLDNECQAEAKHSCAQDGTCDGSGGCRLYLAGTVCLERECRLGSSGPELGPSSLCDGSGTCVVSGTPTSCGDFSCMSPPYACYGRCTADPHCASGSTCELASETCK